jgi:colanic acid/amylovoran biosynthesis glycosyltransferase
MDTIRALHLFREYLRPTENWAFRLISHIPDCELFIGSKRFLKHNFYSPRMHYIRFPLTTLDNPLNLRWIKLLNFLTSIVQTMLYGEYVFRACRSMDLMHSHFSFVAWQYRSLAGRLGIPHIVSFYGVDYEHFPYVNPAWKSRYRNLFRLAHLFLCEGTHGAKTLRNMGCPEEKIRVARLGVDVELIPFFRRTKRKGELRLLQIATFVEKKGYQYTIDAFMKALEDCPYMTLTLVGTDPNGIREKLQNKLKTFPAASRVCIIDGIDFSKLHQFMQNYQILIQPSCYSSQRDCEGGAPVIILDAQATGMPVIATNHCDIPEEVIHLKSGLLTPEKDDDALASSIRAFYEMGQEEYDGYSENAREHIQKNYDVKRNARVLRQIYEQVKASV